MSEYQVRCKKCSKLTPVYKDGLQIVRDGYSGPRITLCSDCAKKLKNWLSQDGKEGTTPIW